MKNKICKLFMLTALTFLVSCSDFLDINEDPNNPTDAQLSQILPSVQINLAGAMSGVAGMMGEWTSLYTHHNVQRGTEENDYAFKGDDLNSAWRLLNTFALNDLKQLLETAEEFDSGPYMGIGKIMKAYLYSIMVDMWGDIPYTEAQQGAENISPAFDDDETIYNALLALIDEGIADLERPSSFTPGSDDLFYGGDLDNWRKMANTLKLKLYTQIRLVRDVSAEVNKLIEEDDMISANGEDFQMQYGVSSAPDSRNPTYAQEYAAGGARNYISPYFYELMTGLQTFHTNDLYLNLQDPRVPYYFFNQISEINPGSPPENPCSYCYGYEENGQFIVQVPELQGTGMLSIYMFSFNIDPNEGFDQSSSQTVMGLYPIGGKFDDGSGGAVNFNGAADSPQRLLTYYTRKFLEAELAISGVSNGDARAAFEEGMLSAFEKVNDIANAASAPVIGDSVIMAYVGNVLDRYDNADMEGKLEHIMTQKWIATYGFSIDAYTDYRRTGYPQLHDPQADNLNVTSSIRLYPVAFPYPQSELDRNPNAPDQRNITSGGIFWDN